MTLMRSLNLLAMIVSVSSTIAEQKAIRSQELNPLPVELALRSREFAELVPLSVSPDGHWLAYTVADRRNASAMNVKSGDQTVASRLWSGTDIWILNVLTGEEKSITEGRGSNWLPVWSPDGRWVAFLSDSDKGGQPQLWTWNASSGEIKRVSPANLQTNQIEWLPDSKRVVVTAVPTNHTSDENPGDMRSRENRSSPDLTSINGSSVSLYRGRGAEGETDLVSDPWDLNEHLRDLITVNIATGEETVLVAYRKVSWYRVSPDGLRIAYTIPQRFERPDSQQILFDLAIVAVGNAQERIIARNIRLDLGGDAFSWSPTSLQLSLHAGGMDERNFDCFVLNLANGSMRDITMFPPSAAPRLQSSTPLWDTDRWIYFLREGRLWKADQFAGKPMEAGHVPGRKITQLISSTANSLWKVDQGNSTIVVTHDDSMKGDGFYKVDLRNGSSTSLLEKGQCYTCVNSPHMFPVTADGSRVLYFAEDAQHAPEIWISDATFDEPLRVTKLSREFDKYKMGTTKLLSWRSDDGEPLQGALLLPANYQEDARYPLVVWVYGGGVLSDDLDHFGLASPGPFNLQLLGTRGYAVLLPDAPLHLGTPMLDIGKTVLPGVDKAIESGIADPNRLAVIGHSFGGYSVLSLIVQSTRFRAAIEIDGLGNLLDLYGEMDQEGNSYGIPLLERGQGLMGGTPWQFRDRYIENSPVFYFDRVQTPLLIVHGSMDSVVSPFLADEIFVELRRLGKEVEYAKYANEGHSPLYWRYPDQADFCNRMISWLDEHLKKSQRSSGTVPTK